MSDQPRVRTPQPADSHRGLRLLGLAAVVVGVLLLMAAAFVLSYTGIHAVALSAGVSPRFARIYPAIFDAMLVVACAAVLSLRGAGLPSRCYAWLTMLVLLAAAAGADTLHATNTKLPHKPAAAAAAIIPWALVLIGFGLLLAMLRQARLRRAMVAGPDRTFVQPGGHVEVRHGIDDLLGAKSAAGVPAVRYLPGKPDPPAEPALDLAIDADAGQDDPASDEAHLGPASAFSPAPTVSLLANTRTGIARGSGRSAGTGTVPVARRAPETGPAPEIRPRRRPAPAPKAGAAPETGPVPEPEAGPVPEAEDVPEGGPELETGPEPELEAAAGPGSETGPGSDEPEAESMPDAEAAPAPAVSAQFDRVRSSPVPPES